MMVCCQWTLSITQISLVGLSSLLGCGSLPSSSFLVVIAARFYVNGLSTGDQSLPRPLLLGSHAGSDPRLLLFLLSQLLNCVGTWAEILVPVDERAGLDGHLLEELQRLLLLFNFLFEALLQLL